MTAEAQFRQMVREAVQEGIAIGLERAGYPRTKPRLEVIEGGRSTTKAVRPMLAAVAADPPA